MTIQIFVKQDFSDKSEDPCMIAQFPTTPSLLVHAESKRKLTHAKLQIQDGFNKCRVYIRLDEQEIDSSNVENLTSADAIIETVRVLNKMSGKQ